ncbi:NKL protein, partial [Rhinoptilus africanus]|nr:NKL protein [Rhinoptilus africanus]
DMWGLGRGRECSSCTKLVELIKGTAGDDPDEAAVEAAVDKVCQMLGKRLIQAGKWLVPVCKWLVNKSWEGISEALRNGDQPQDPCAAFSFCKA